MKHESYWGLRQSPFRTNQDPAYYFAGPTHEEALARLQFLVDEHRCLGILSGGAGCGKSLLLEVFARLQRRLGRTVCSLNLLGQDARSFLWAVAAGLGTNPRSNHAACELWQQIRDRLSVGRCLEEHVTLLLDDSERTAPEVRGQILRLLKTTPADLLTVILTCNSSHLSSLGADLLPLCELHIHLESWEPADVHDYVHTSLARAGRERGPAVFDESAVLRLAELTDGVPRRVSQLAELALVAGAGRRLDQIDADTLDAVYQELCVFPPVPVGRD